MNLVEDWILTIADAWWVHVVVGILSAFDGFFPAVPSESVIVTLSSLWSSSGSPAIWAVALAAWAGAFTGDNIGFFIGRAVGADRFRVLREGRGRAAVEYAERGLERRAWLFLMTARYIPFGRTAVNLVAGGVGYPHSSFWPKSLTSTFVWAVYSCSIGAVAGSWFENNHLLAVTVAVILAVVIALIVERLVTMLHRALDLRTERHRHLADSVGNAEAVGEPKEDSALPGEEARELVPEAASASVSASEGASRVRRPHPPRVARRLPDASRRSDHDDSIGEGAPT